MARYGPDAPDGRLVTELNQHNYQYYTLDQPQISDKEYDLLYDELVTLEQESGIVLPDSPTRRVGANCSKDSTRIVIYPHYGVWTKRRTLNRRAVGIPGY